MMTVDGVVCASYKDACFLRGLLQDNREWDVTLREAATFQSGRQLRSLFATILVFCEVTNPLALWEQHYASLVDDIVYRSQVENLNWSDEEIKHIALRQVDRILKQHGKSLADYPPMLIPPAGAHGRVWWRQLFDS